MVEIGAQSDDLDVKRLLQIGQVGMTLGMLVSGVAEDRCYAVFPEPLQGDQQGCGAVLAAGDADDVLYHAAAFSRAESSSL